VILVFPDILEPFSEYYVYIVGVKMNRNHIKIISLLAGLIIAPGLQAAETSTSQASSTQGKAVITPAVPYNYAYPAPVYPAYNRPYYPQNRQSYYNRNANRFNGRNDFLTDNRMNHMNRVVSDMISDMFGDTAGDFEFDVNVKFKARGNGKGKARGRGRGYSDSRMQQRYNGDYRGNYQGRGNYYGGGNAYQYQGYPGYGYPAYAPATANPAPTMNTAYPPQPAAKSQSESTTIKAE